MGVKRYFLLLLVLFACILLLFASYGYPLFGGDSICFVPAAYHISHGEGLINRLYDASIDPVHHSFLFYPPLFPYVVAWISSLLPQALNVYHIVLAIINIVTMLVLGLAALKASGLDKHAAGNRTYVLAAVWLLAFCTFQDVSTGRPEILAKLILSLLIYNNVYKSKVRHELNGMLAFLSAVNSPVSAFYIFTILAGLYVYNGEVKKVYRPVIAAAICGALFVAVYPYSVGQLLAGMRQHAHNVIFNRTDKADVRTFLFHHIVNPVATFGIGVFLLSVGMCLPWLKGKKMVQGIFAALMVLVCYFTFRTLALSYNMYVLAPAMLFVIFVSFMRDGQGRVRQQYLAIAVLLLCGFGMVRRTAVFVCCLDKKYPIARVNEEVDRLAKGGGEIGVSNALWPVALPYKNVHLVEDPAVRKGSYDHIILQQNYTGYTPMQLAGYKVVKNEFIYAKPRAGKLSLGNTYPWYQYAVYDRIPR